MLACQRFAPRPVTCRMANNWQTHVGVFADYALLCEVRHRARGDCLGLGQATFPPLWVESTVNPNQQLVDHGHIERISHAGVGWGMDVAVGIDAELRFHIGTVWVLPRPRHLEPVATRFILAEGSTRPVAPSPPTSATSTRSNRFEPQSETTTLCCSTPSSSTTTTRPCASAAPSTLMGTTRSKTRCKLPTSRG